MAYIFLERVFAYKLKGTIQKVSTWWQNSSTIGGLSDLLFLDPIHLILGEKCLE